MCPDFFNLVQLRCDVVGWGDGGVGGAQVHWPVAAQPAKACMYFVGKCACGAACQRISWPESNVRVTAGELFGDGHAFVQDHAIGGDRGRQCLRWRKIRHHRAQCGFRSWTEDGRFDLIPQTKPVEHQIGRDGPAKIQAIAEVQFISHGATLQGVRNFHQRQSVVCAITRCD